MLEREKNFSPEEFAASVYPQLIAILEKGERKYKYDGIRAYQRGFFCDQKAYKGSSNISFEIDATEGLEGPISISVNRPLRKDYSFVRGLVLTETGLESLSVGYRKVDSGREDITPVYFGAFDPSRISLEALSSWIEEARINLEARTESSPCEDSKQPRLIQLTSRIGRVFGVSLSKDKQF